MAKLAYPAPLSARARIRNFEWSGEINVGLFGGMRTHSLEQARSDIERLGVKRALAAWEKDRHPPMIEIYPDAIGIADGRHRMLAAYEAGAREMPVRVRMLDEEGTLLSQYHALADLMILSAL
jgi:hypothetical protein